MDPLVLQRAELMEDASGVVPGYLQLLQQRLHEPRPLRGNQYPPVAKVLDSILNIGILEPYLHDLTWLYCFFMKRDPQDQSSA